MSACPSCGAVKTQIVTERRLRNGWTQRLRWCVVSCNDRWRTYELPAASITLSMGNPSDLDAVAELGPLWDTGITME